MKTGLVSVTFRECSVREIIKLAKENNLKSIEWGSTPHVEMGNAREFISPAPSRRLVRLP